MSNQDNSSLSEEAAAWFVRLRDERATEEDRVAFAAWRKADPAHAAAYAELESLWSGLDHVSRHKHALNPVPRSLARTPPRRRSEASRLRRFSAAAIALLFIIVSGAAITPTGLFADYRTAAGEQRSVALADGSVILLDSDTSVSVDYSAKARRITLHEGEAYFTVVSDEDRPFSVDGGVGSVRVLGTAFSVRRDGGATRVVVTENSVRVSGPLGGVKELSPEQAVLVTGGGVGAVKTVDTNSILAWRRGRLVFEDRSLVDVLDELDRYHPGVIVSVGSGLADVTVTGSFSTDKADAALETIARTLPVDVTRMSDWVVLVRARQ